LGCGQSKQEGIGEKKNFLIKKLLKNLKHIFDFSFPFKTFSSQAIKSKALR